jgi:hypothetical protein
VGEGQSEIQEPHIVRGQMMEDSDIKVIDKGLKGEIYPEAPTEETPCYDPQFDPAFLLFRHSR